MSQPAHLPRIAAVPACTVRDLAEIMLARLDGLTDELVRQIQDQIDSYVGTGGLVDSADLYRSCRENLRRVGQSLCGTVPVDEDAWDAPRRTGRLRAQQGVPLESVLRSYRLGGRVVWEALVQIVRESGQIPIEVLLQAVSEVWAVVDVHASMAADAYREIQFDCQLRDRRLTAAMLNALISGDYDGPVSRVAEVCRLPLTGPYVVIVAPIDVSGTEPVAQARERLGSAGIQSAWAQRADNVVGLVATPNESLLRKLKELLPALVTHRAGVSWTFDELGWTSDGFTAACLALKTLAPHEHGVAWLDDHLAEALIVQNPELSQRIATSVFGAVLRLAAAERDTLLGTVDLYLANERSVARCAELLFCHRNTVQNRLNRFESLTRLCLKNERDALNVSLGLAAMRLKPWRHLARHSSMTAAEASQH